MVLVGINSLEILASD
uniref:Uncharacterized protein n=1 Tax=Rhizophora mucronata TaxID=61149 RepID=A0A2P2L5P4_RHIMU